uniref:Small open reading frame n=1 Tax=Babesia bovis TaxID=5865 RepID=S6CB56_BABBO|nr:small open reading frame [Babesia bovis]
MLAFNMLWKLCVVVAFGLSATATSTEVAQEQPKKESLDSGISSEEEQIATEAVEVREPDNTESQERTETTKPSPLSLEWLLLPRRENRTALTYLLPDDLASKVPMFGLKPIDPALEEEIRKFFSLSKEEQLQKRLASYGSH